MHTEILVEGKTVECFFRFVVQFGTSIPFFCLGSFLRQCSCMHVHIQSVVQGLYGKSFKQKKMSFTTIRI